MKRLVLILTVAFSLNAFGFGAIAYSPSTGATGKSWNQPTLWAAQQVANNWCGRFDCRTAVWVSTGCAAVAASTYNTFNWSYGHGGNIVLAQQYALSYCQAAYGPCWVRDSVCSY